METKIRESTQPGWAEHFLKVNVYPGGSGTEYFLPPQNGRMPPGANPQAQAGSAKANGVPKTNSTNPSGEAGPNGASPKDTPELQNKTMQNILDSIADWLDGGTVSDFLFCLTCSLQNMESANRWRGSL
jgi:hypothetical protein